MLARRFAEGLAQIDGIEIDPLSVETNIVRYRLTSTSSGRFVNEAHRRCLWMLPSGAEGVQAGFYLDITATDVEDAVRILSESMRSLPVEMPDAAASSVQSGSY